LHTPRSLIQGQGLPPFTGGMVGYLGYDILRRLEKIGDSPATKIASSTTDATFAVR
ncbi:hypothetical protein, partial [Streptomyces rimosus]|uniref:hypothetical protein n=1 Tax=Streptomyces rimosus TaxID=1927 RepID=UPI000A8D4592